VSWRFYIHRRAERRTASICVSQIKRRVASSGISYSGIAKGHVAKGALLIDPIGRTWDSIASSSGTVPDFERKFMREESIARLRRTAFFLASLFRFRLNFRLNFFPLERYIFIREISALIALLRFYFPSLDRSGKR